VIFLNSSFKLSGTSILVPSLVHPPTSAIISFLILEEKPSDLIKTYEKLNENGIYITTPNSLTDKELFKNLSKLYWIVMPFYYIDENLKANPLIFASKKFHPTADIIRHRSDFVENTKYYTTDVHIASFTLPKYIFEEIKDVIKL